MEQVHEPDEYASARAYMHPLFLSEWNLEDISEEEDEDGPPTKRARQSYFCEVCDESFTRQSSLTRHLTGRKHLQKAGQPLELPYPCGYCLRSFSRLDHRLRHETEIHMGQKRSRRQPGPDASQTPSDDWMLQDDRNMEVHGARDCLTTLGPLLEMSTVGSSGEHVDQAAQHSLLTLADGFSSTGEKRTSASSSTGSSGPSESDSTQDSSLSSTGDQEQSQQILKPPQMRVPKRVLKSGRFAPRRSSFSAILGEPAQLLRQRALSRNGASGRPLILRPILPCALCKKPFGKTTDQIMAHLETHKDPLSREHMCDVCQIGFAHPCDLERHQRCANNKDKVTCGFYFEHRDQCTGHHPPCTTIGGLSDHERMQFWRHGLRNWEQAQLRSFMRDVDDALEAATATGAARWSVGAACRRSVASLTSLSTMFSELSIESTPNPVDYRTRLSMTNVRHNMVRRFENGPHLDMLRPFARGRTSKARLDALLVHAVRRGDTFEARQLLRAGAAVDGGDTRCAATPLTLAAAGGYADMVSLLMEWGGKFSQVLFLQREHAFHVVLFLKRAFSERPLDDENNKTSSSAQSNLDLSHTGVTGGGMWSLKACSYTITPNECDSVENFSMCPVENERERQQLQATACAMIIGDGDCTSDYHFAPSMIFASCDLKDLPAAIMMCRAIDTYNANVVLSLCQNTAIARKAFLLRRMITTNQIGLLEEVLRTSRDATKALETDASLLKSTAFKKRLGALDLILQHSSAECIETVLCEAIDKNREDVVKQLCWRTSATTNMLTRSFKPNYRTTSADLSPNNVRTMLSIWSLDGNTLDYRLIYIFLSMTPMEKLLDTANVLAAAGAPQALISQAISISGRGHDDSHRLKSTRLLTSDSERMDNGHSSDEEENEADEAQLRMILKFMRLGDSARTIDDGEEPVRHT